MTKTYNLYILIFLVVGFSCKKDQPEKVPTSNAPSMQTGVYITNEGNYLFGNASVSYYDNKAQTVSTDLFSMVNQIPLGDICQSMTIYQDKAYLLLNNSGKIEVVNPTTFKSISTITGLTSPRYMLPVSSEKAYITDLYAQSIAILNLNTSTVTGHIACTGWTENLLLQNNIAYITNVYRNKLYLINTETDQLTDSITIGYGGSDIIEDKENNLWVLCKGDVAKQLHASLYKIDPTTKNILASFSFATYNDSPSRLKCNGTKDTLYYINQSVYRMAISEKQLPTTPFIYAENRLFYGLGIHPSTSDIFVSDAIDYVQKGRIYIYSASGQSTHSFLAGIIPGDFIFH